MQHTPISAPLIQLENISVRRDERDILRNIDFALQAKEIVTLIGPNGAGKSTLLSLITADNPQAYAYDIWLFERKRGSGESIWDIKKNIGYVSPELHLYFEKGISVLDAVASGFFDTIGLFRRPTPEQLEKINAWLKILGISEYATRMMYQLSLGQQRLAMLARALVKTPPLLILDEPTQGLDVNQTNNFKSVIEAICLVTDVTLIYVSHYQEDLPSVIRFKLNLKQGSVQS